MFLNYVISSIPSLLYVSAIYVWYPCVGDVVRSNENQKQKLRRIISVGFSTIFSIMLCHYLFGSSFSEMGIVGPTLLHHLSSIIRCFSLTVILFSGPIIHTMFFEKVNIFYLHMDELHSKPVTFASVYLISPLLEELVFRSCTLSIIRQLNCEGEMECERIMSSRIVVNIAWSTLLFSLSHAHHFFEKDTNVPMECVRLVVSALFGMLSSFYFLRTNSIWGPFVSHIFCNILGAPPIDRIGYLPRYKKIIVWSLYLIGLLSFFALAGPLTR